MNVLTFLCLIILHQIIWGSQWDLQVINIHYVKKIVAFSKKLYHVVLILGKRINSNGHPAFSQSSSGFTRCHSLKTMLHDKTFPPVTHLHPFLCPHVFFWK